MTALMSCFVRYYYTKNNKDKVYEEKIKVITWIKKYLEGLLS